MNQFSNSHRPIAFTNLMFSYIYFASVYRYCYLRQEVDGTYILEMHKDERQCEAKATIVMDFCTEVVQVSIIDINEWCGVWIRIQILPLNLFGKLFSESKAWPVLF